MLLFDYEKNTLFLFVCQVNTNELHRRFVCHFDVDGCSCAATIFQKWRQSNRAKCDESEKEKEKKPKKSNKSRKKKNIVASTWINGYYLRSGKSCRFFLHSCCLAFRCGNKCLNIFFFLVVYSCILTSATRSHHVQSKAIQQETMPPFSVNSPKPNSMGFKKKQINATNAQR